MALISFSGIASGIDSQALIKALLDQQRSARVNPLKSKIAELTDTNDVFGKLHTQLGAINNAIEKFRTVNGSAVSKRASSTDETVITATANAGATNGSYEITVNQLAKNATLSLSSASTYTSADQVLGSINDGASAADRTVSVTIGQGASAETVDVVLTSSTTISDFVTQFNDSTNNATASLVNIGSSASPDYRVVIASNSQGEESGYLSISSGAEVLANNIFNDNLLDQATDAEFQISGIGDGGGTSTITRSSNSISDVIPGLTFNLIDTSASPVSITVSNDTSQTAQNLQSFVDAYNQLVTLIKEHDAITSEQDGEEVQNTFGALAKSALDENAISVLRNAISGASISGREINTLADLGITTQRDGTLKFDSAVLTEALSTDSEAAQLITQNLGDVLGGVDGALAQFTRFGGLIDNAEESNKTQISDLNNRIGRVEQALSKQEQTLIGQFARLESLIGQLTSTQSTLAQLLPR